MSLVSRGALRCLRASSNTAACRSYSSSAPKGSHKVFSCAGIESEAFLMRRCTQLAIGVELLGSKCAMFLFNDFDFANFHSIAEQGFVMNNFVMLLHCGAMWWYQGYTRDHILARHVTSITLQKSLENMKVGEPLIAYIETRPWTHRLEFRPRSRDDIVSLGRLKELGAIHVDQRCGEVYDPVSLDLLLDDVFEITSSTITLDEEAKRAALVGDFEATDLLQEDTAGEYERLSHLHPLVKQPFQWPGRYAYWNFCVVSLVMGFGSVILFVPKAYLPWPQFMMPGPSRNFEY
mmetsp:Transcript_42944/g.79819  ORF Transcript_42944/g.79819 Transcript_42944/m.79819 type:complete len:291 (+) Transcript_42944:87-959(+)